MGSIQASELENLENINMDLVKTLAEQREQIDQIRSRINSLAADTELWLASTAEELQLANDRLEVQREMNRNISSEIEIIRSNLMQARMATRSTSKTTVLKNECKRLKNEFLSVFDEEKSRRKKWKWLYPSTSIIVIVATLTYAAKMG